MLLVKACFLIVFKMLLLLPSMIEFHLIAAVLTPEHLPMNVLRIDGSRIRLRVRGVLRTLFHWRAILVLVIEVEMGKEFLMLPIQVMSVINGGDDCGGCDVLDKA